VTRRRGGAWLCMRLTVVHSCIVATVAASSAAVVSAAVGAELMCALREHCVRCCVQLILLLCMSSIMNDLISTVE
jgi:hypothetical protein